MHACMFSQSLPHTTCVEVQQQGLLLSMQEKACAGLGPCTLSTFACILVGACMQACAADAADMAAGHAYPRQQPVTAAGSSSTSMHLPCSAVHQPEVARSLHCLALP